MRVPAKILDGYGRPATVSGFGGGSHFHGYRGAEFGRKRGWMPGMNLDQRKEVSHFTRAELMRKARFLKKDVGLVRGVAKSLVDHSIGPGVYPIPATSSEAFNEAAFEYFAQVAEIGDVTGRMTFWELQGVRTKAKFVDGDGFTIMTESRHGWPQFQYVRAHNCGNFEVDPADGWHDGVRLDRVTRARAYRFRVGEDRFASLPAQSVIHSYLLEEADTVRGVTALAHAINDLHDVLEALDFEHSAIKDNSRVSRVIHTDSGDDEEDENYFAAKATEKKDRLPLEKIFGAEIQRLKDGEKLEQFVSDRPSPTFMGWIDYIGRGVTAGSGFPYEFAWDPKGVTGPAQRFILEKVKVSCEEWRANEIADSRPFYVYAIAKGISEGHLSGAPDDWWRVDWLPGATDVTIDRGRDGREGREAIKAGLDSFKRFYARRGLWYKKELAQVADEQVLIRRLADERGLEPESIVRRTEGAGRNGNTNRENDR